MERVYVFDPALGFITYTDEKFKKAGYVHEIMEPTPEFYNNNLGEDEIDRTKITFYLPYLFTYKKFQFRSF